jgi:hypothetical protein
MANVPKKKEVNALSAIRARASVSIHERNQTPIYNSRIIISAYLLVNLVCQMVLNSRLATRTNIY